MGNFTHDFEVKYDNKDVKGEIEFNTDGKVSFSFTGDPILGLAENILLNRLFDTALQLYKITDSLEKIRIVKKVV